MNHKYSAYAKLGMISSALPSDSDDVTKLLNVSLDLIARDGEQPVRGTELNSELKSAAMSVPGALKGETGAEDSERAVEVLSFLVSKTKVCFLM